MNLFSGKEGIQSPRIQPREALKDVKEQPPPRSPQIPLQL